jgi:hypothetical protein
MDKEQAGIRDTFATPTRARSPFLVGSSKSSIRENAWRQPDIAQRTKDRAKIVSLIGLNQPESDEPPDCPALDFDGKPQQCVRRRKIAPASFRWLSNPFGALPKRARCCRTGPEVGHARGALGESSFSKPTQRRPERDSALRPAKTLWRATSSSPKLPLTPVAYGRDRFGANHDPWPICPSICRWRVPPCSKSIIDYGCIDRDLRFARKRSLLQFPNLCLRGRTVSGQLHNRCSRACA